MSRSRKRNPYRGSRAFDPSCRSHGGCPWCAGNRTHGDRKGREAATDRVVDHELSDPNNTIADEVEEYVYFVTEKLLAKAEAEAESQP